MERSSVIVADDEPRERHIATLTLRRGATSWGAWGFDAEDAGVTISVGGCAGCDWPIAAPGVGPLLVLFTGECLLIKNDGASEDIWLNGARLWPRWVPLEHGDVVEIGTSCMEVALADADSQEQELLSGERALRAELPRSLHEAEAESDWRPLDFAAYAAGKASREAADPRNRGRSAQGRAQPTTTAPVRPRPGAGRAATMRVSHVQGAQGVRSPSHLRSAPAFSAAVSSPEPAPNLPQSEARQRTARLPEWTVDASSDGTVELAADGSRWPTDFGGAQAPGTGSIVAAAPSHSEYETPADQLPTILGNPNPLWTSAGVVRGVLFSTALAVAYAGWIVLLDYI